MYLQIYRSESKFFGTKKTNVIVVRIYRHPHMDLNEFKDYYVNKLLNKLSKENKIIEL